MNGATGPKPIHSAPTSAAIPDRMANTPFQKVEMENVDEIQSLGNTRCSVCWHTYHASNVENRIDVEIPPKTLPANSHQKFGLILQTQQRMYRKQNIRQSLFLPKRSASGPVNVPKSTLDPNPPAKRKVDLKMRKIYIYIHVYILTHICTIGLFVQEHIHIDCRAGRRMDLEASQKIVQVGMGQRKPFGISGNLHSETL